MQDAEIESDASQSDGREYIKSIVAGLVFLLLLIFAFGLGARHTVVIEAETRRLNILFSGKSDYWDFGEVTSCVPLDTIDRSASSGAGPCDLRRYQAIKEVVSIQWSEAARATIVSGSEGNPWHLIIENQNGFKDQTRIILPSQKLNNIGALSFSGDIKIGNVASSGEKNLLLSGRYEFRERSLLSRTTETIKSGELRRGELVSIKQGEQETSYGFLLPALSKGGAIFVSAISELGKPEVEISYFGGRKPIYISPNWIDRALSSPIILALSILIPVSLALLQFSLNHQNDGRHAILRRATTRIRRTLIKR